MINKKTIVDVSIVSANFNNSRFLHEYFKSILNSTVLPKEIVFVDDGSTDYSIRVLSEYENLRFLKVIKLKKNIGFANALNIGIDNATSSFLMRLDPDDFIVPSKIEIQYEYLLKNPSVSIVGTNAWYYNQVEKEVAFRTNLPVSHEKIKKSYYNATNGLLHSSVMGKSKVFKSTRFRQEYYPAEDYDFFLRILNKGFKVENIKQSLIYYRIHKENNLSKKFRDVAQKTFKARQEILNERYNKLWVCKLYFHILFYRKSLLTRNQVLKSVFLLISGIFNVRAVSRRLFKIS